VVPRPDRAVQRRPGHPAGWQGDRGNQRRLGHQ